MDRITIRNLQVYARHGVMPEENTLGQRFLVTAVLEMDTRKAGRSDQLCDAVNYAEVCQAITSFMVEHTFQLIEAVAEQLAAFLLLQFPAVSEITIELQKPWAPIGLPVDTVSVSITRKWHTAYVALGSNLGDKQQYLDDAITYLRSIPTIQVEQVSDYLTTAPYGGVEQDDFLNGALRLKTLLPPHELLEVLQEGERRAKRERLVHWGPRTLDLDILFYDDLVLWDADLVIPHPEIPKRSFVLEPMVQLAPYLVHPVLHRTMTELQDALAKREEKS